MDQQGYDELYKVVLVGDPGVGKSNLLATFLATDDKNPDADMTKSFNAHTRPTIGVEFGTKILHHPNGARIKVQVWDTGNASTTFILPSYRMGAPTYSNLLCTPSAGQERYRAITNSHYRRAGGALIVYDVSSTKSFDHAKLYWLEELKKASTKDSFLSSCISIVGNKTDLELETNLNDTSEPTQSSFVSPIAHDSVVEELGVNGSRVSAKAGTNVYQAFYDLIMHMYDLNHQKDEQSRPTRIDAVQPIQLEALPLQHSPRKTNNCC